MIETNRTIYKLDSKSKLRSLNIRTQDGYLIQTSGLLGGNKVTHKSMCKPKNIGKSNETNAQEQALLQAASKIVTKLREGYSDTQEKALNNVIILPMLAKVLEKEQHKIDWNTAYVQPKLDGMRMLDSPQNRVSRKNVPITTVGHILVNRPGLTAMTIDGELYAHGFSFQENMKLIKKYRPGITENIKYHVYDIVSKLPFIDRYSLLQAIVSKSINLKIVPTFKVENFKDVKEYHTKFLSEGYEGTMVRWGNEGYKINGRSSNLLKYKDFLDNVYLVTDIVPSDKNPKQGVVTCKGQDIEGNLTTFNCGMKFSHAEREEILINKENYIGKMAEVRYFEETDKGLPRFPVCVGFRLDR